MASHFPMRAHFMPLPSRNRKLITNKFINILWGSGIVKLSVSATNSIKLFLEKRNIFPIVNNLKSSMSQSQEILRFSTIEQWLSLSSSLIISLSIPFRFLLIIKSYLDSPHFVFIMCWHCDSARKTRCDCYRLNTFMAFV